MGVFVCENVGVTEYVCYYSGLIVATDYYILLYLPYSLDSS